MTNAPNLNEVDWSILPKPEDDGAASHLVGMLMPSVPLMQTSGETLDLSKLSGRVVVYAYPMTGRPDTPLPDGWDAIPGARGCTPQSCAFRDHAAELAELNVEHLFGLSTQNTADQKEAAERLHLPFLLLSDSGLTLAKALRLPMMEVDEKSLHKRLTMILRDGVIEHVFYPVFPPDQSAGDVIAWLKNHP